MKSYANVKFINTFLNRVEDEHAFYAIQEHIKYDLGTNMSVVATFK